jgi:hypothetical protein
VDPPGLEGPEGPEISARHPRGGGPRAASRRRPARLPGQAHPRPGRKVRAGAGGPGSPPTTR